MIETRCPQCGVAARAPKPGMYQCPRCGAAFSLGDSEPPPVTPSPPRQAKRGIVRWRLSRFSRTLHRAVADPTNRSTIGRIAASWLSALFLAGYGVLAWLSSVHIELFFQLVPVGYTAAHVFLAQAMVRETQRAWGLRCVGHIFYILFSVTGEMVRIVFFPSFDNREAGSAQLAFVVIGFFVVKELTRATAVNEET